MKNKQIRIIALFLLAPLLSGCVLLRSGPFGSESRHTLAIFSTTDEHQYIYPYDYMAQKDNESIGIAGLQSALVTLREKHPNNLLISAGDIIQGSLIGEMEAVIQPPEVSHGPAIIDVFNLMNYDAAAIGNHDLTDFGIDFFRKAQSKAEFPWLSSTVYEVGPEEKHLTAPYALLEREIDGIPVTIGVIGFTPPQIMEWGRRHLEGKIRVEDILDSANKYLPYLKENSDIIIAVAHSGIDISPPDSYAARENAGYWLAQLDGIDALLLGHQHARFPGEFSDIDGIDNKKGLIHGVPAVLPASWGRALGFIELKLSHSHDKGWRVRGGSSRLISNPGVPNPEVLSIAEDIHVKTIEYVNTPIGETDRRIASYFSRVKDSALTQLINEAQLWYAAKLIEGSEAAELPLLSAAAPFVAGREGPEYFTDVSGELNIGDITDIYLYPNTLYIMSLTGLELKDYLEHSALNFSLDDGHIVDYSKRAFNFDIVEGVEYTYDLAREEGERLSRLSYNGTPVEDSDRFLLVMNNYRASGGGGFPHMTPENTFLASTSVNREAIIAYISEMKNVNPLASNNWDITLPTGMTSFNFRSSPRGNEYINEVELEGFSYLHTDEEGWGIYEIELR